MTLPRLLLLCHDYFLGATFEFNVSFSLSLFIFIASRACISSSCYISGLTSPSTLHHISPYYTDHLCIAFWIHYTTQEMSTIASTDRSIPDSVPDSTQSVSTSVMSSEYHGPPVRSLEETVSGFPVCRFHYLLFAIAGLTLFCCTLTSTSLGFISVCSGAEWGLNSSASGSFVTMVYAGQLVGNILTGPIADNYGRRKAILWFLYAFSIFAVLNGFTANYETMALASFGIGIGYSGVIVMVGLLSELLPAEIRDDMLVLMNWFWALGATAANLMAWFMLPLNLNGYPSWRFFSNMASIPIILSAIFAYLYTPESPRWLYYQQSALSDEQGGERLANKNLSADFQRSSVENQGKLEAEYLLKQIAYLYNVSLEPFTFVPHRYVGNNNGNNDTTNFTQVNNVNTISESNNEDKSDSNSSNGSRREEDVDMDLVENETTLLLSSGNSNNPTIASDLESGRSRRNSHFSDELPVVERSQSLALYDDPTVDNPAMIGKEYNTWFKRFCKLWGYQVEDYAMENKSSSITSRTGKNLLNKNEMTCLDYIVYYWSRFSNSLCSSSQRTIFSSVKPSAEDKEVCKNTIILTIIFFTIAFDYYGIIYLSDRIYEITSTSSETCSFDFEFLVLSSFIPETLGVFFALYATSLYGFNKPLIFTNLLAGISFGLMIIDLGHYSTLIAVCAGRFAIISAFHIIYVLQSYVYSTRLRMTAMSYLFVVSNCGSLISTQIADSAWLPVSAVGGIFSLLAFINVFSIMYLKEFKGTVLDND